MSAEVFVELEQRGKEHRLVEQRGAYRVLQYKNYRFLSSGGRAIQGAMDVNNRALVQSPVVLAMLEALHLPQHVRSVLNLGVGSAAIERYLGASKLEYACQSVDVSREVLSLATEHFGLPGDSVTECVAAESYVHSCQREFDIVFCDLAMSDRPAACLSASGFQQDCATVVSREGVFALNLLCNSKDELRDTVLQWRRFFSWTAVYAVPKFDNVVVYAAHQAPWSLLSRRQWAGSREAISKALILP